MPSGCHYTSRANNLSVPPPFNNLKKSNVWPSVSAVAHVLLNV
jgi:hypothetical protein